ncbi:hypothetical protein FVE85_4312 [Porphyridium purpureum]|uniref:Uncharacterized protein n=1 Tax=Porphyridium purpureum TaxID=35688 RepID=A0A5J4YVB0_PORPP|nr:hypothetical protein FVE85_4312 [Porphyridium purpureum]|eukprot:POR1236..scf229_5
MADSKASSKTMAGSGKSMRALFSKQASDEPTLTSQKSVKKSMRALFSREGSAPPSASRPMPMQSEDAGGTHEQSLLKHSSGSLLFAGNAPDRSRDRESGAAPGMGSSAGSVTPGMGPRERSTSSTGGSMRRQGSFRNIMASFESKSTNASAEREPSFVGSSAPSPGPRTMSGSKGSFRNLRAALDGGRSASHANSEDGEQRPTREQPRPRAASETRTSMRNLFGATSSAPRSVDEPTIATPGGTHGSMRQLFGGGSIPAGVAEPRGDVDGETDSSVLGDMPLDGQSMKKVPSVFRMNMRKLGIDSEVKAAPIPDAQAFQDEFSMAYTVERSGAKGGKILMPGLIDRSGAKTDNPNPENEVVEESLQGEAKAYFEKRDRMGSQRLAGVSGRFGSSRLVNAAGDRQAASASASPSTRRSMTDLKGSATQLSFTSVAPNPQDAPEKSFVRHKSQSDITSSMRPAGQWNDLGSGNGSGAQVGFEANRSRTRSHDKSQDKSKGKSHDISRNVSHGLSKTISHGLSRTESRQSAGSGAHALQGSMQGGHSERFMEIKRQKQKSFSGPALLKAPYGVMGHGMDLLALPHNAIRCELKDVYHGLSILDQLFTSVDTEDVRTFQDYWILTEAFIRRWIEYDQNIFVPWFQENICPLENTLFPLSDSRVFMQKILDALDDVEDTVCSTIHLLPISERGPRLRTDITRLTQALLNYFLMEEKHFPKLITGKISLAQALHEESRMIDYFVETEKDGPYFAHMLVRWPPKAQQDFLIKRHFKKRALATTAPHFDREHVDLLRHLHERNKAFKEHPDYDPVTQADVVPEAYVINAEKRKQAMDEILAQADQFQDGDLVEIPDPDGEMQLMRFMKGRPAGQEFDKVTAEEMASMGVRFESPSEQHVAAEAAGAGDVASQSVTWGPTT